jgi:peptide deformylase
MSVLKIIIAPNPLLQMVSQPIEKITNEIQTLAHNMLDTMYAKEGIGLSAVQVGILKRIIVVDVEWPSLPEGQHGTQYIMINPEVIHTVELNECKEGCLSFPDEFVRITRPKTIKVQYQDLNGTTHQIQADGLLSTCIQHEIDHLNGKTISSYISHQKKIMMFNRLKKKWQ